MLPASNGNHFLWLKCNKHYPRKTDSFGLVLFDSLQYSYVPLQLQKVSFECGHKFSAAFGMPVIPYSERPEPFSRQPWWLAIFAVMELVFALALFGLLLGMFISQGPPKNDGLELSSSCYPLFYPGIIAVCCFSEDLGVAQCWMM